VRVLVGQTGPFQVEAWSPKPVSYQWQKATDTTGYTNIAGATSATYTPPATTLADNGTLVRCAVTNAVGVNNSSTEFLMVATAVAAPTHFTSDLTAYGWPGRPFSYTIGASGGPGKFTYAASPLPAGLTVNAATGEIAGTPTVEGTTRVRMTVSDSAGSSSAWLTLTIKATTTDWGAVRLAALSTRGWVGTGENCLIAGFVLQGDVPKNLLLRAVGPALTRYGVAGVLSDPRLTLIDSRGKTVLTVDDWSPAGTLPAEMQRVGAFALDPGSKDAAVLATVAPGNYTVMVEGVGGATGVALVEIYDVDAAGGGSRLGGLSTRGIAGRDANQMIAGFAIDGAAPRNVLLRAIGGPTLSTFGVAAGLGDPVLEIYNGSGALVARNDDWAKSQQLDALQQAFVATGVFALAGQNKDAALVLTLPPGTYTAKVTNRDQPEGVALIEVYQAP
jgi:hypothetical protein